MSSTDPQVLDDIVKAYDVRGTVPDQLNADVAHALGVAFARFAKAPTAARRPRHAAVRPRAGRCVRRGRARAGRRRRRPRPGLDRPRLLRRRHARRARGDVHRLAQPGAVQRRQVLPRRRPRRSGQDTGLAEIKAIAGARARRQRAGGRRRRRGSATQRNLLDAFADHVLSFIDPTDDPPAAGRRRHRQRHGRPGRAGGVRAAAADRRSR